MFANSSETNGRMHFIFGGEVHLVPGSDLIYILKQSAFFWPPGGQKRTKIHPNTPIYQNQHFASFRKLDSIKCNENRFLALTSLIFVAQKCITYGWNCRVTSYSYIMVFHQFDRYKYHKNSKNCKFQNS